MAHIQLPVFEQVFFEESPLDEVVCQLRFNTILRITSTAPVEFQDAVRRVFPVLERQTGIGLAMAGDKPLVAAMNEPVWQFRTGDEKWIVSLTSGFLALKTTGYRDIEEFLDRFMPVVEAFEVLYEPPFYARVGLRYVNRVIGTPEGEEQGRVPWEVFFNPHLASPFSDAALTGALVEAKHHMVLDTEHGQIGWRYSFDKGEVDGLPAERFILDFDHYVAGQIPCADVRGKLLAFNDQIYRLFRWCLTDEGSRRLKPRPKGAKEGQP